MKNREPLKLKNNADFRILLLENCLKMVEKKLIIEKLISYKVILWSKNYMLAIDVDLVL